MFGPWFYVSLIATGFVFAILQFLFIEFEKWYFRKTGELFRHGAPKETGRRRGRTHTNPGTRKPGHVDLDTEERFEDDLGSYDWNTCSQKILLTPHEQKLFRKLWPMLVPRFYLCPKVRISDLIAPANPSNFLLRSRLNQKHVDFAVIEISTGRMVAAVELDDKTHEWASRKKRDEFVNAAFANAGVPLIRGTIKDIEDAFAPGSKVLRDFAA